MKINSLALLALLLLGTLSVAGCGIFHHGGPRQCKPGCASAAGQQPCPQPGNCDKAAGNKPCCEKMQATETPAK